MNLKYILLVILTFILIGCTYSVNVIHSEGSASDMVDEEQIPSADISPDITIL